MKKTVLRVSVVADEAIDEGQIVQYFEEVLLDAAGLAWYDVKLVSSEEEDAEEPV